jgi:hypothetical protein
MNPPTLVLAADPTLVLSVSGSIGLVAAGLAFVLQEYQSVFDLVQPDNGLINEDSGFTLVDEDTGQILTAEPAS